ncbi:MAG: hypothetical protein M0Z54_12920 [Thermaerobacter sp.]|nr:hypothetical protein [Thermaerobacter sp.]
MPRIHLLPWSPDIALASSRVLGHFQGDPADRIFSASAPLMNLTLVIGNERRLAYLAVHNVPVFVWEAGPGSPPKS